MKKQIPRIVIVGRANVGKSTLFNRFIGKSKALISPIAGTTRDRNIDRANWRDFEFEISDTGGLDINPKQANEIEKNIVKQAESAIKYADLILFMTSVKDGVTNGDRDIAKKIVKAGLKDRTMLLANKADSPKWRQKALDMYGLNLGDPIAISAASGSGSGDLLDLIIDKLPAKFKKESNEEPAPITDENRPIKVAIIGKPNVGKSSLLNSILGEDRVIVTNTPHTTRESHDSSFKYGGREFILIDTAGISKQSKLKVGSLENKSIEKTLETIGRADIVLLITEADKRIEMQDKKITQKILENSKSVVIVANKWDLIPDKGTNTIKKYEQSYRDAMPYLWWAPVIFVSAKMGLRTKKILDIVLKVDESRHVQVDNGKLAGFLKSRIKEHRPSRGAGLKNPFIYKIEQVGINPPRFNIYVNDPLILHFSYIRFLQNNLREKFDILGTPIQIEVKKQKRPQ